MLFQLGLIAFALFAVGKTASQYNAGHVSKYWLIVFSLFWMGVIGVALAPQTTDVIAAFVGVGRGADLLVYIAIVILSYGVYRILVRQRELEMEITRLVREVAIAERSKE